MQVAISGWDATRQASGGKVKREKGKNKKKRRRRKEEKRKGGEEEKRKREEQEEQEKRKRGRRGNGKSGERRELRVSDEGKEKWQAGLETL